MGVPWGFLLEKASVPRTRRWAYLGVHACGSGTLQRPDGDQTDPPAVRSSRISLFVERERTGPAILTFGLREQPSNEPIAELTAQAGQMTRGAACESSKRKSSKNRTSVQCFAAERLIDRRKSSAIRTDVHYTVFLNNCNHLLGELSRE